MHMHLKIPHRDYATKLFEQSNIESKTAICSWLHKEPSADPSLYFSGCSKYFIFDIMRHKVISVRVTPEDVYQFVNDYHIRINKTICEFATPLALAKMTEAERNICQYAFTECSIDCLSSPGQILSKESDIFSWYASEISRTTFGGDYEKLLIDYLFQVYCAEQKIYAGKRSFPISFYEYDIPTIVLDEFHYTIRENRLDISFRPYLCNEHNPKPWRIAAVECATPVEKSYDEDIDGYWEDFGDLIEKKPIAIYLTQDEMENLIDKLIYQLEKLGFSQPESYTEEYFPLSTTPSPRRKKQ